MAVLGEQTGAPRWGDPPGPLQRGKAQITDARSQTPDHRNGAEGQLARVFRGPYRPSAHQPFNRQGPQPSGDTAGLLLTVICQLNALIKCANITKLSEPGAEPSAMEKLPLFHGGVPAGGQGGGGELVAVDEVTRGDFTRFHSTSFKKQG